LHERPASLIKVTVKLHGSRRSFTLHGVSQPTIACWVKKKQEAQLSQWNRARDGNSVKKYESHGDSPNIFWITTDDDYTVIIIIIIIIIIIAAETNRLAWDSLSVMFRCWCIPIYRSLTRYTVPSSLTGQYSYPRMKQMHPCMTGAGTSPKQIASLSGS
jgi:hypothetical protein